MKVVGLKSNRVFTIRIADYLVDWKREVSKPQARVKQFLYPYWRSCVVLEECPAPGCGSTRSLRVDLINLTRRIAVEVSPSSSHSFNKHFHKDRMGFAAAVRRDLDKQEWCLKNNFQYISLDEEDIDNLSKKLFAERGIDL